MGMGEYPGRNPVTRGGSLGLTLREARKTLFSSASCCHLVQRHADY